MLTYAHVYKRAQAGRHILHSPRQCSNVKTVVFICITPALTFMSGAPLKPHLACEEYCHYTPGDTQAWKVTEGAMLQGCTKGKLDLD